MTEQDREKTEDEVQKPCWLDRVSRAADRGRLYAGKRLTGFDCAVIGMLTVLAIRGSELCLAALGVLAVMELAVIVSAAVWNDGGSDDE